MRATALAVRIPSREEQVIADLAEISAAVGLLHLALSPAEAWILISHVQLALRHPLATGPASAVARQILAKLEPIVIATPALREVYAMGWGEASLPQ